MSKTLYFRPAGGYGCGTVTDAPHFGQTYRVMNFPRCPMRISTLQSEQPRTIGSSSGKGSSSSSGNIPDGSIDTSPDADKLSIEERNNSIRRKTEGSIH